MVKLKNILYVEDEPDIQAIAKLALETVGDFNLNICSSGEEALEAVKSFTPDLFLLDVMMPGMDGPSTLKTFRENPETVNIPAIFMTAKVQPNEIVQYRELGALDVIAKPFDPMTLATQINDIWQKHIKS